MVPDRSTRRTGRIRRVSTALLAAVVVAACGGGPAGTPPGSSEPSAPSSPGLVLPDTPSFADAKLTDGAQTEIEGTNHDRIEAGFAALMGEQGATALKLHDDAGTAAGEKRLPEAAEQLGIDVKANALLAAAAGAPGFDRPLPPSEWTGSMLGHAASTISMMTGLLASATSLAGDSGSRSFTSNDHDSSIEDGVSEDTEISTTWTVTSGGGKIVADVTITARSNAKDVASGTAIGQLIGTAKGHIEVNACPDADGKAEGRLTIQSQEELTPTGGTGAGFAKTFDAPFTLLDGDDAHLIKIDSTFNMTKGEHGTGTPGGTPGGPFDWGASVSLPVSIDAHGGLTVDRSNVSASVNNATDANVRDTAVGYLSAYPALIEVAKQGEEFWRSGKCIDVKTNEESRSVDPKEQISLKVDAIHKFDGAQVKAPIEATFGGKEKLEPSGQPQDPPATFEFTAGDKEKDAGTIDLKQTSRRGIGKKQVVFTVGPSELLVTINGTLRDPSIGANLTITIPQTRLKKTGDVYEGTAAAAVSGSVAMTGCSTPVSTGGKVTIRANADPNDGDLVRIMVAPGTWAATARISIKCGGATFGGTIPIILWFGVFTTGTNLAPERVGETTTLRGIGAAQGATATIKVERPTD